MGTGRWNRVAAVAAFTGLVAVMMFGLATATAPAGNRSPASSMAADEGASYGANVSSIATLANVEKSAFVDVRLEILVPKTVVAGVAQPAKFKATSCPGTYELLPNALNPEKFVCNWGAKVQGQSAKVLVVWETPLSGSSANCNLTTPTPTPAPCLTLEGTWFIKEGSQSKGAPDTFPTNLAGVSFVAGTAALTKARGYALGSCSSDPASKVSTAPGDALQAAVCPSTDVPGPAFPLTPGLLVRLDEGIGQFNKGIGLPTLFVCIPDPLVVPAPGDTGNCPSTPGYFSDGYTPWNFDPPATITFVLDNTKFTGSVSKILHNGEDVTENCVRTFNGQAQTTTFVCLFAEQGGYDAT